MRDVLVIVALIAILVIAAWVAIREEAYERAQEEAGAATPPRPEDGGTGESAFDIAKGG